MPIKRNYVNLKMVNDAVVMQVLCFYLEERHLDDANIKLKGQILMACKLSEPYENKFQKLMTHNNINSMTAYI